MPFEKSEDYDTLTHVFNFSKNILLGLSFPTLLSFLCTTPVYAIAHASLNVDVVWVEFLHPHHLIIYKNK